jgi:uncharacterized repeat protein (TIGR03803 family)
MIASRFIRNDMAAVGRILGNALLLACWTLTSYAVAQTPGIGVLQNPTLTTIYNFTGTSDGGLPDAGMAIDRSGVLYGTTASGGAYGGGTVFSLRTSASPGLAWTETVLHSFGGGSGDGAYPYAKATIGCNGVLYGTTGFGGAYGFGTVFSLTPPATPDSPWTETVLHSFGGSAGDGQVPYADLTMDIRGVLYGTTQYGGAYGAGTVFSILPRSVLSQSSSETVLYSFNGSSDGSDPVGNLTASTEGLFGTTASGGAYGNGTAFLLTPQPSAGGPWSETVLHSFGAPGGDGTNPWGGLVIGVGGTLYGTTQSGGDYGGGTVFSLAAPTIPGGLWSEVVLESFASGGSPQARLLVDYVTGELYGTTSGGGNGYGTVFRLTPSAFLGGKWTETVLHTFAGNDGSYPFCNGGLVEGGAGVFYGTTFEGGADGPSGPGTVFVLTL